VDITLNQEGEGLLFVVKDMRNGELSRLRWLPVKRFRFGTFQSSFIRRNYGGQSSNFAWFHWFSLIHS